MTAVVAAAAVVVGLGAAQTAAAGLPATRPNDGFLRRARLASAVALNLDRGVSTSIRTHDPLTPLKACAILLD